MTLADRKALVRRRLQIAQRLAEEAEQAFTVGEELLVESKRHIVEAALIESGQDPLPRIEISFDLTH